jgi:type IV pilus assembly protein PilB
MSDPLLFSLVQDLESQTGYRVRQVVATHSDILKAIELGDFGRAATSTRRPAPGPDPLASPPAGMPQRRRDETRESAPIADLVNLVVNSAIRSRATGIHIEPQARGVLVRHRVDGLLKEVMDLPRSLHEQLVGRIKVMAGIDIAGGRLPQDGRLRLKDEDGREIDFSVSTMRTMNGEKVVMRVRDHRQNAPILEELGLTAAAIAEVRRLLEHRHGLILVAGPARSGRTTTLASAVRSIKSGRTSIVTIEDPIEYEIPGVNQTQVDEEARLTFASGLRAILNQDADVVVVGEIRDRETAALAMQGAETGHLVLSTLLADDAPSATTRLIEMGVEPCAMASGLVGIVAQRLLRRLCASCRRRYSPDPGILGALNITQAIAAESAFYQPVGCEECHHTGYRGRVAVCEVIGVTGNVRRLIARNAGEDLIRDAATGAGMITLRDEGVARVQTGLTSVEELLRVAVVPRLGTREACPVCGGAVAVDFIACPHCGHRFAGCEGCGRGLQAAWQFCPFCATPQVAASAAEAQQTKTPREVAHSNLAEFRNHVR